MNIKSVDLVLLVDKSSSMRPCFDQLRKHLASILRPMELANLRVRFGLIAYSAASRNGVPMYDHHFVGGSGPEFLARLYAPQVAAADFFTEDPAVIQRCLDGLKAQGNEDTLVAIDIAADFPFGPADRTRRVIAVFTDERIEDGVAQKKPLAMIPDLCAKLTARRIKLFVAGPGSEALHALAGVENAEVTAVGGGDGLESVDFGKLLAQMGRTISMDSQQAGPEPSWRKALFGQDRWGAERLVTDANRLTVLAVGEEKRMDTLRPDSPVKVRLEWKAAVDLDLHAFCLTAAGAEQHVYFANLEEDQIELDNDAGVGDVGGHNVEVITVSNLSVFHEILFATKIFSKGGCYADYGGQVRVEAGGETVAVPLTSRERADWCVIAKVVVDANGVFVKNLNAVTDDEPDTADF